MKVIGCILIMMIPCLLYAEPAAIEKEIGEHCIYLESISAHALPHIVHTFLEMDPLSADQETQWHYYIVHSHQAKQKILTTFLSHLQHFHKHSKLPFKVVADYWEDMFDVPIQIFVFQKNADYPLEFCTSVTCERIVEASQILGLGFIWNGALSIAEDDISEILDVPAGYSLVTTIFLPRADKQEVSRVLD